MVVVDTLNDKFAEYPNVTFTLTDPGGGVFVLTIFFNAGLGTATIAEVVAASINIGAHEGLDLLGTRHHDAFLPIGTGEPSPFVPGDPLFLFDFFADAVIVEDASIEILLDGMGMPLGPESDYYAIDAGAGDIFHIEVISKVIEDDLGDTMDAVLSALGPLPGTGPVPYFTGTALQDDERESTDSHIWDLVIPADGTYLIEVFSSMKSGMAEGLGKYELLAWRFRAEPIPEPTSGLLVGIAVLGLLMTRRRR